MIQLPHGCKRSKISVIPKNWNTLRAPMSRPWRIFYRFYDGTTSKLIPLKGMNEFKTLAERQEITRGLIENETQQLKEGYNPITKTYKRIEGSEELSESTAFADALVEGLKFLELEKNTRKSMQSNINIINRTLQKMKMDYMPINAVRPKHILKLLQQCKNDRALTPVTYNHYRKHLRQVMKMLTILGCIDVNPVVDIPLAKGVKKIKQTLTPEERKIVADLLITKHPEFWRYLQIFFHGGTRTTELFRLKVKDVNLQKQQFKVLIKKRGVPTEVMKTIKTIALPYWKEQLQNAAPDDYVFSIGLLPGPDKIREDQITKRWYRLIKIPLKITADFNSLRHSNSTEVVDILSSAHAAKQNGHTSEAMVVKIYDVGKEQRDHEALKKVNNSFI